MKRNRKFVLAATLTATAIAITAGGGALAASTPAVTTGLPSGITDTTAVVNGTVNPEGSATTYYFQWGPTNTYGLQGVMHSAGSGTKVEAVASPATGLTPGTTYHYRIVAGNRFGTSLGRDRIFTTTGHPPAVVTTGGTFGVGHAWAVVTGSINPEGEATSWAFQYGTTPNYDHQTYPFGTVAASTVPQQVGIKISALSDGTTFHYRLVAIHSGTVVSYGGDQMFTTLPFPRPVPGFSASITPRRAKTKPYLFTTTGTITLPASIPAAVGCNGTVTIRFFLGRKFHSQSIASVQPNCTFAIGTLFHKLIKKHAHTLRVEIHFRGNPYLAPAGVRAKHVGLG